MDRSAPSLARCSRKAQPPPSVSEAMPSSNAECVSTCDAMPMPGTYSLIVHWMHEASAFSQGTRAGCAVHNRCTSGMRKSSGNGVASSPTVFLW